MDDAALIGSGIALVAGAGFGWWLARRGVAAATLQATQTAVLTAREQASKDQAQVLAEERNKLAGEQATALARLERQSAEALAAAQQGLDRTLAANRKELADDEARLTRRDDLLTSRETALSAREKGIAERDQALVEKDRALARSLAALDQRDAAIRTTEDKLKAKEETLITREAGLAGAEQTIADRLSQVAGMTAEQAKAELLATLDTQLATEQAARISRVEKDTTARAKELAVELVARAIQRYAAEHTAESTTAKVKLPEPEAKGRIIGKEGRNIKAFEQATGVDVIIDETPDSVTISCFDPVRRELARRTLEALLEDGRIQPARIEEELASRQQELDREVLKRGEDAAFATEVSGLHPQLLRLLGKLHYRTSYGQNVLVHTQEVAFLCGAMAADMGLDPKLGRRCGLLHDIGKAIDHEQEGSHPELGHQALKRWGESEIVANAALAHHEGHAVLSVYTVLAAAADAISAARPGARHHSTENYLKRLAQLESIALGFTGVQKAYAIQAGRELRVIVHGHEVPDTEVPKLARDIARAVEDQVSFPGEVKVTCIREIRHIAVAR